MLISGQPFYGLQCDFLPKGVFADVLASTSMLDDSVLQCKSETNELVNRGYRVHLGSSVSQEETMTLDAHLEFQHAFTLANQKA